MLGKFVRVRVTKPLGRFDSETNTKYLLNFGVVESGLDARFPVAGAYIMGVNHPVRRFDGRVIAVIRDKQAHAVFLVVSPKSKRFIIHDIRPAVAFRHKGKGVKIECFYERSCGAVVFRGDAEARRFLLIKNKRSAHWGFPKGHVEAGETDLDTAKREVLEETGLHIDVLDGFCERSSYTIQGRIDKTVLIFLATTADTKTVIQQSEIENYIWLPYDRCLATLNYENDKAILQKAQAFLTERRAQEVQ